MELHKEEQNEKKFLRTLVLAILFAASMLYLKKMEDPYNVSTVLDDKN